MTASSESISMFRNSGSELFPTVLSAGALQPPAVPGDLLSVTGGDSPHHPFPTKGWISFGTPSNPALYMEKSKYSHNSYNVMTLEV